MVQREAHCNVGEPILIISLTALKIDAFRGVFGEKGKIVNIQLPGGVAAATPSDFGNVQQCFEMSYLFILTAFYHLPGEASSAECRQGEMQCESWNNTNVLIVFELLC